MKDFKKAVNIRF